MTHFWPSAVRNPPLYSRN